MQVGFAQDFLRDDGAIPAMADRHYCPAVRGGLGLGLAFTPPDYQMGENYRIAYIHVPGYPGHGLLRDDGLFQCGLPDLENQDR